MGQHNHHEAFVNRVVEMLRAQGFTGFQSGDVHKRDFPFDKQPPFGIIVSPLDESEGTGMNDADDIRYAVQVTRVMGRTTSYEGFGSRVEFRSRLRNLFHRRQIGVQLTGGCELITSVRFGTIKSRQEWDRWGIETSVVRIYCLIREPRD